MPNDFGTLDKMEVISKEIVTQLAKKLFPLTAFTKDFSSDVSTAGKSVDVNVLSAVTASVENISGGVITSYGSQTQDLSFTSVPVKLDNYAYSGFAVEELVMDRSTAKDIIEQTGEKTAEALAKKVLDTILADINATNYPTSTTVTSGFDLTEYYAMIKECWDNDMANISVVLDNTRYTQLITDLAKAGGAIDANASFSSGVIQDIAGTRAMRTVANIAAGQGTVKGFAAVKEAMAIAMRPLSNLRTDLSYGFSNIFTDEETGISIRMRMSQSPSDGKITVIYDTIFGFEPLLSNALIRLV